MWGKCGGWVESDMIISKQTKKSKIKQNKKPSTLFSDSDTVRCMRKIKLTGTFPLRTAYVSVHLNRPSSESTVWHFHILWAVQRPVVKGPFHIKADVLATVINRIKLLRLITKEQNQLGSQTQLMLSADSSILYSHCPHSEHIINQKLLKDN